MIDYASLTAHAQAGTHASMRQQATAARWLSTLAHDIAFDHPGRRRQTALAHRTRLSGAQS